MNFLNDHFHPEHIKVKTHDSVSSKVKIRSETSVHLMYGTYTRTSKCTQTITHSNVHDVRHRKCFQMYMTSLKQNMMPFTQSILSTTSDSWFPHQIFSVYIYIQAVLKHIFTYLTKTNLHLWDSIDRLSERLMRVQSSKVIR